MTTAALGQTLHAAAPTGPAAVPGEIVVAYRSGVDPSERAAARSAAEVRARRTLLVPGAQLVSVVSGQTVQAAIAALERRRDVRYAEPNWVYQATSTTPDDPLFANLWGLHNTGQAVNGHTAGTADDDIDAPEAWDRNRGGASTVVAVVDSGVAWDHPDLSPNIWSNPGEIAGNGVDDEANGKVDDVRGWDFAYGDNNPWDYDDHGTHVAGTIAARGNNGLGITGVAWQASVMPIQALNANGSGNNANIADAFTYAAASGAKVVNASLGGPAASQAMSDAITSHPKTLFVVAAGNAGTNNDTTPTYPCSYTADNLICVAATDNADNLAGFSNYGALSVDLAAPGVDIDSARPHYTDSFTDDFQTSLGNWTVQSGPWGRVSVIGSIWLTDSPSGNYADNADWQIRTTSKIDLGARTDCALKFTYGTFLEDRFDWLYAQSSTDGTTWTDLTRIGDTNGAVQSTTLLLGAAGSRYYRFRLTSDDSINKNGVFIDNVRIGCPGGTYGSADYQFLDGTSMASPHVAGAAAVLFSDTPVVTVAEVKAALLSSGNTIAGLSGKTVTGRRLNLNAALTSLVHVVDTTTTITSDDPDPSVVGQPVTVQYSVANNEALASTPTGNVRVTDGSSTCTGTVAAGQCTLTLATAGSRSLTATYAGDATHKASPASAVVSHRVDPAGTTTTVTSDTPDPSSIGQDVTVNVSVAAAAPGSGTPTGNVTVSHGVDSCSAGVEDGGCTIHLTTAGARTLTATYLGSSDFNGSSATEAHTVNRLATTSTITSDDPDPSVVGQAVTVHYTVAAAGGTPTGNVTVSDDDVSCTGTVAAAHCAPTFTSAGAKQLTATYGGSGTFEGSTSPVNAHDVDRAETTTTIATHSPDPSTQGTVVTVHYTVSVDAPGAGTPTATVSVSDGVSACSAAVAAGACDIALTTVGSRTLVASYAGDGNFRASSSAGKPHTVDPPPVNPPPDNPPSASSGAPPPVTPLGPALVHVLEASQTHAAFRISGNPRLVQISRRAPVGSTFTYRLDGAASVRFDFTQPGRGRTVKGKCVPASKPNRRRPRCALRPGSLVFAGHAGVNAVRFNGWLSHTTKLKPGKYGLRITATTPGVGATSQTLRFKIVR